MKNWKIGAIAGALAMAAGAAYGGGFYLEVLAPDAKDARMKDAVVAFKVDGCYGPGARLLGTAEGIVDGKRRTIPLRLKNHGGDTFSVTRQWPKEGRWVLAMTAISPANNPNGKAHIARSYAAVPMTESGAILVTDSKGRNEKARPLVRRPNTESLIQLVDKMLREPEARRAGL